MSASSSLSSGPTRNQKILFWASFFTLIAAGIGFSVRGVELLGDWGNQFGFTQTELGTITGGGLIGFGLAIIFFSFFADKFGYGKLMLVAFLFHTSSAVITCAATPIYNAGGIFGLGPKESAFYCLNLGMWLFALGNGTCEAVINPLTATLFPRNKTHWLNILHAGWPGGLILGAVIMLVFKQYGDGTVPWEYKLGVFLVPVLLYGLMMVGRTFPKSEAQTAGVPISGMMKQVGLLGFTLGAALIGLAMSDLLKSVVGPMIKTDDPAARDRMLQYIGWGVAAVIWVLFALVTRFALGSLILAFIYLMHALVGYVELGTDSWITNITNQVLKSETNAKIAFIWTNVLMFTLRFFAGPIVHKINPIGLLFASAALGTIGLYMLGHPMVNSIWPWMAAVTIYGLGKTFYWPTLLGVISERFPKGGALALGLSGGVGMIGAGILGGPGIGYKQDYFAVDRLQQADDGKETYRRYMAKNDKGEPDEKGFPYVTDFYPTQVPKVAGIDNAKLKVFEDYGANLKKMEDPKPENKEAPRMLGSGMAALEAYADELESAAKAGKDAPKALTTTLESDLVTLIRQEKAGKQVEAKLKENLTKLKLWWDTEGRPNYDRDKVPLVDARLYGAKTALLYTAAVPLALAVGFMLLILYFLVTGGYKQVHLEAPPRPDPHRNIGAPADMWHG